MSTVKLMAGLLIAAALVVFGAQNTESVSFHFLAWDTLPVPTVLALAIAVLIGVMLSWVVSVPGRFHGMRQRRDLQHQLEDRARAVSPDDSVQPPSDHEEPS